MYKIYPNHQRYGYRENPTIVINEEEIIPTVNEFLSEGTEYGRCCVVKSENNTDEVYGIYYKERKENSYQKKKGLIR